MSALTGLMRQLPLLRKARSKRASSYDRTGRNADAWVLEPGETRLLMEADGPGAVTHIWMTQSCRRILGENWQVQDPDFYRKVLIRIYWDGEKEPSVLAPLGDFFCLGNSIASNFQSLPFSCSMNPEPGGTNAGSFGKPAALNCYLPMPFRKHARVELVNENDVSYIQYFYIDYELYDDDLPEEAAYFHCQWRRANPFPGWAPEIRVNDPHVNIPCYGEDNYVILEAKGRGHYIGCNISVTNFQGTWWGEGDDMIFVDGEKFPPSLHGTGSEDYLNQAYGMQENTYLFNGSSKWLHNPPLGYQTSYVFHLLNPVHFRKSVKVTIEHGHADHLANEYSSTAYWYQVEPHRRFSVPPVGKRLPVRHPDLGVMPILEPPGYKQPKLTAEQKRQKADYRRKTDAQKKQADAGRSRQAAAQRKAERAERKQPRKKGRK